MIHLFDLPEIKDNVSITELLRPTATLPEDFLKIQAFNELRKAFRGYFKEKFPTIRGSKAEFLNTSAHNLDAYLATHLETWAPLSRTPSFPLNFEYSPFIASNPAPLQAVNLKNEEVMAAEIVMARYIYAVAYSIDANKHVVDLRQKINGTFVKDPTAAEDFKLSCKNALAEYDHPLEKLNKIYNAKSDIFISLPELSNKYLEFSPIALDLVKNVIEANADGIFFELLRIHQEFEVMVSVARSIYEKLSQSLALLKGREAHVRKELLNYLDFGVVFAKVLGMYSLMKLTERDLKGENYSRKKFPGLVFDIVFISQDLLKLREVLSSKKSGVPLDTYAFCMNYLDAEILPQTANHIAVYSKTVDESKRYPGEQPFLEWTQMTDYYSKKKGIKQ